VGFSKGKQPFDEFDHLLSVLSDFSGHMDSLRTPCDKNCME